MRRRRPPTGAQQVRRLDDSRRPTHGAQDGVRTAAAWVLERALAARAPVSTFLDGVLDRYDARDADLLNELVLGSLRWLRRLDHVLGLASHRPFESIDAKLRAPLRLAAYQLLFLERVPAHAAVHEAVEHASRLSHRGGASFVNAVLRRIARDPRLEAWPVDEADPVKRLGIELSHPDFLVRRWLARHGERGTRQLLEANNRPRPMHLLAFRDRGGRELLAEQLIDEGLEVEPSKISPLGLTLRRGDPIATEAFRSGSFYIQDEASQVAAWLPPPQPGERILDAAAAPGGKALSLLAWEPTVRVFLADLSVFRLQVLRANFVRLERQASIVVQDALQPSCRGGFDRVVVDLPCSGTGTLRKHPELKWRLSEGEVGRLAAQGEAMVEALAPLVAPGGLLVALTCSIEEEENERVVERVLECRPELERVDLGDLPVPWKQYVEGPGCWRLSPADEHDGFTVQVLRRRR